MPNERNTNQARPSFLQRGRDSFNAWRQRQVQGARNATPGHQGWGWQLLDMASEPFIGGNLYNSQAAPGERRFQFPGESAVRGIGSGIRNIFGNSGPQVSGSAEGSVGAGGQNITIDGSAEASVGAGATAGGTPFGQRPQLDQFMLMREAPGWGAMMAHLNALYGDQNRRRQR